MKRLAALVVVLFAVGFALGQWFPLSRWWSSDEGSRRVTSDSGRPQVVVIGLDGATWEIVKPLADAGALPNIAAILERGAYGRLHSSRGYSAPSWTSIFTGEPAEVHGVADFRFRDPWGLEVVSGEAPTFFHNTSRQRQVPALWSMLTDAGLRMGTIGHVITSPPEEVNGFLVTGDGTPWILKEGIPAVVLTPTEAQGWAHLPRSFSPPLEGFVEGFGYHVLLLDGSDDDVVNYDRCLLARERDVESAVLDVAPGERAWLPVSLDAFGHDLLRTPSTVIPAARVARGWSALPESFSPPLEVVFPSGVATIQHGQRRENPLFLLVMDTTDDGVQNYDQVRFADSRDGRFLSQRHDAYGLRWRGEVLPMADRGALVSDRPPHEILLAAQGYDVPFRLYLTDASDDNADALTGLRLGSPGAPIDPRQPEALASWYDWVLAARRATADSDIAIPGWVHARPLIQGGNRLRLDFGGYAYQDFARPLFPYAWPPQLLADGDPRLLLEGVSPVFRHQGLKIEAAKRLVDARDWDVFSVGFTRIDLVKHGVWNDPDRRILDVNGFNALIRDEWERLDGAIGEILARCPEDATVILCSDHGFMPIYDRRRLVYAVDRVLEDAGWIVRQPPEPVDRVPDERVYEATYVWELLRQTGTDLGATFQLVDDQGNAIERWRHSPGMGAYPTSKWRPGTFVKNRHTFAVPPDVDPGRYTMQVVAAGSSVASTPDGGQVRDLGRLEIPALAEPNPLILPVTWNPIGDVEVLERLDQRIFDTGTWVQRDIVYGGVLRLVGLKVEAAENDYLPFIDAGERGVDWSRSRAYVLHREGLYSAPPEHQRRPPRQGFYVNVRGREPEGIVDPLDYKEMVQELRAFLATWRIRETGEPFFSRLRVSRDVASNQPDILFEVAPSLTATDVRKVDHIDYATYDATLTLEYEVDGATRTMPLTDLVTNQVIGNHGEYGIFAVAGPPVTRRGKIPVAREVDIAPTVLRLLGVPVPDHIAGRPIREPFGWGEDDASTRPVQARQGAPGPSDQERFEQLRSLGYIGAMERRAAEVMDTAATLFTTSEGSGPGQRKEPRGIAVAPDGSIFLADFGNHRIQRYDAAGTYQDSFGGHGDRPGQFHSPNGLLVLPDGNLVVCDTWNHRLQKVSPSGRPLRRWTREAYGFYAPKRAIVAADGGLLVSDTGNARILHIGPEGDLRRTIGGRGEGRGQLREPVGLALHDGSLWVADVQNHRLQRFALDGTPEQAVPVPDWAQGVLNEPDLLVRDGALVFPVESQTTLGSYTPGADGIRLRSLPAPLEGPTGLAATRDALLVTETHAHRVTRVR